MKITRRQLRNIIREATSQKEIKKIEELWWNQDPDGGEYPERAMASALIDSLGVDRKSLRLWTLVYPWGELYEPWTYYGGGETPGFTVGDINRIIDYFNSNNDNQLSLALDAESGFAVLEETGTTSDEISAEDFADAIAKADFETAV